MKLVPTLLLCCLTIFGFSSCALVENFQAKHLDDEGKAYEIQPAVLAARPFNPQKLSRFYDLVPSAHPPLMAAVNLPTPALPKTDDSATLSDSGSNWRTVRTTAYCHDEKDHIPYGKLTGSGERLKFGDVRSAAADWSRYPLGTIFRIPEVPDVIYQVDDYGSALVGTDTIDLYKPTLEMMNEWGSREVAIEILKWGSFEESMELIENRTHFPHVQKMVDDLHHRIYRVTNFPTEAITML